MVSGRAIIIVGECRPPDNFHSPILQSEAWKKGFRLSSFQCEGCFKTEATSRASRTGA
ncbi:hypothetical protein SISNIDRAFT_456312, partial [Sistotremastrum niveocremeum HHB9708]|uniref:Uncharacterized protein n=2 Tax=Sistotremastraceae TaxID=3402574 RepID=A0A166A8W7_9AGAM